MIICYIKNINSASAMILSASKLAMCLGKTFGIVLAQSNENKSSKSDLNKILLENQISKCTLLNPINDKQIVLFCEEHEVSFIFLQLFDNKSSTIQKLLTACRELRIPYLFYKDEYEVLQTESVLLPVNFLEEELEKAQFASAFGRFCNSKIEILQANDYGSKAATNTRKMQDLFEKFNLIVNIEKAIGDSFKVDKEAVHKANIKNIGLIIITASREYGLDDLILGPKELHLIKKSTKPILLVNPRGDLYALCD
ncbi:MAG: hypothetical protein ACOYM7_05990 [Paludibacter sp.]